MKIFSGLPLDPSILKIPLEFATSMIDWKVENDEFHPNLTFCRLDNDDEETMRKFSELHSICVLSSLYFISFFEINSYEKRDIDLSFWLVKCLVDLVNILNQF